MTDQTGRRTFTNVAAHDLPDDLTGVRWPDGTVECRFRLRHPNGSLSAADGDVGLILTEPGVACTHCSEACDP